MQVIAWAVFLLILLVIGGLLLVMSGKKLSVPKMPKPDIDWDGVSASVRNNLSSARTNLGAFWTFIWPYIKRFLGFLFGTKWGWGLILVSIIVRVIWGWVTVTPTQLTVQREGIPPEIMPYSATCLETGSALNTASAPQTAHPGP